MLRLTLWNSAEDEQHTIELYQNAPVNLNYQFTDVTEINKAVGSYTQTFRIPATKSNTDFFGDIKNPSTQSTYGLINGNYSVKRKIRAELSYNSIPLMKGYVQIKGVYIQKKDFADIELIFFGDALDMATKIGDKMLSEIDTTDLDHTLTKTNITDSWAATSAEPFDGTIRYGVMDKGANWSSANSPAWDSGNGVWQGFFTPYVKAKWLVNQILEDAGFTYTSDFIDGTDFAEVYLPAFNGSQCPQSSDTEPEAHLCAATIGSNYELDNHDEIITFRDDYAGEGGYDYTNSWFNSSNRFNAPYAGLFTFTLNTAYNMTGSQTPYVKVFTDRVSQGNFVLETSLGNNGLIQDAAQVSFTFYFPAGRRMYITAAQTGSHPGNYLLTGAVGNGGATWVRLDSCSEPLSGQDVDLAMNMPKIKQMDFLTGLQKMFNLVFIPDKNKPNHILIETFKDYTATGTSKDWTNKIDYNKDVVIKPTTDLQAKRYEWTHDIGQDFINVLIKQQYDRNYGRYEVLDPENDFASGEKTITSTFAPYLMSHIPNSNFIINRCITNDGSAVKDPKPRLAFWCGQSSTMGNIYIRNDNGTTDNTAHDFPLFSNYNVETPEISSKNLNYGYERDFFYVEAHPLHTLYYKYWMPYVNELYSHESRILTAYFKLTRADIQDFEFSDKIYIKDTNYRVLKISNYDATQAGAVKVELIKVISDVSDCQFTPSFVDAAGAIRFLGGQPIEYGNQKCCERYGYIWRPRVSKCYPRPSAAIPPSIS